MRFVVRIGEREVPVALEDRGGGRYGVEVDGRPLELHILDGEGPTRSVIDGEGRQRELILRSDGGGKLRITGDGSDITVEVMTRLEAEARRSTRSAERVAGWELFTPLPGKIKRILARDGETVEKGRPLIIMEAMKMENELTAPDEGVILEISVAEGETVEADAVLIRAIGKGSNI